MTDKELFTRAARCMRAGKPEGVGDYNVLGIVKGKEHYLFLYDDHQRAEALRELGRCAGNPTLSLSWYDAVTLSHKIRQAEHAERNPTNRLKDVV